MSLVERHEVAGLDDRDRGFSRMAELHAEDHGYRSWLRYEGIVVTSQPSDSPRGAVSQLVAALHAKGYTQLRTRLSFKGEEYLGSQEPWVEYPDPPPKRVATRFGDWLRRLLGWGR